MAKNRRRKSKNYAAEPSTSTAVPSASTPVPMEMDEENNARESEEDEDRHISEDEEGGIRLGDIYIPPPPKPALTFDSDGPRLIISHIINVNFKSYAGKQYLGPFHKSFTSIIGPNGSGKSNVIDSLLFVFGYKATKIRTAKVVNLIHHSDKNGELDSASVTVYFHKIIDGPGELFTIVPNSEFNVSRTVNKLGVSYYEVNGQRVVLKQVAAMLRSHGIDLDRNRFLILQGEIEQIALMPPKARHEHDCGMLEYLEEIIGTSIYKQPLEQLSEKVEELTDKRKDKLNLVQFVEQERAALVQPMQEAVELMNMTNQTTVLRNLLLQKYIYEVMKMSREKEDLKARTEIELQEVESRIDRITEEIQENYQLIKEGSRLLEVHNKEKDAMKKRLYTVAQKLASVRMDIKNGTEKSKNLRKLIEKEKTKLIEYEQVPEKNRRDIEECKAMLEKHDEELKKAEEEKQTLVIENIERTRDLIQSREAITAKLLDAKRILDEAKSERDLARVQLKIYNKSKTDIAKLEKCKADYSNAKSELEKNKRIKKELSSSLPHKEKELMELEKKLENYQRQEHTIQSELRNLRAQLEESQQRMSAKLTRNNVLNWVMQQKRDGTIPGIFGRMGDLGRIDEQYEVAVGAAFSALESILTDTVSTATKCIEGLKRDDIGSCTFLALDKQEHFKEIYAIQKTYPAPRFFDLITVADERVLPAFYYVMQDTLYADNIVTARKIAFGNTRYRVVTRTGEIIETSGTVTGGGLGKIRSRMGTSVQEDTRAVDTLAIQAIEQKMMEIEQRRDNSRTESNAMEAQIATLQKTTREGKDTLNKVNIELRHLSERVPTLKNQIDELERKLAASQSEDRTAELETTLAEAQERMDKAEFDVGEVAKELAELDDHIKTLASAGVVELDKKIKDLTKKIQKLCTEVSRLTAEIATNERKKQVASDKIATMEPDLLQTERKIEESNTKLKQITLDKAQHEKELEEIDVKINEIPSQFAGAKEKKAKLEEKIRSVREQRTELSAEIDRIQKLINEYASKIPVWEKDLRKLELLTIEPDDSGITIPGLEEVEPLKVYTDEELEEASVEELRAKVTVHRQRIGDQLPNMRDLREYRAKQALFIQRVADLEAVTNTRKRARELYDDLKKRRHNLFLSGFTVITAKLKEMYQMITLGGDAELELVDSLDPFSEGIVFSVRPPSKSWKTIENLSGGEKTLSSLALVFALHFYKPSPFYVMDEIDAALDFKNVSIVANYIKERTKNAQFIVISLRNIMFEVSHRLVGIYKTEDCTRGVSIENKYIPPVEDDVNMDSST